MYKKEALELESKRAEYKEYIDDHVKNVYMIFKLLEEDFRSIITLSEEEWNTLKQNILNHDASKYSDEEFEPYRAHFHPVDNEEKESSREAFEEAWRHHYGVNPHHWNYWVNENTNTASEMDMIYVIEMICDWMAMSYHFKTKTMDWYDNNINTIVFHPNTKETVEEILKCILSNRPDM